MNYAPWVGRGNLPGKSSGLVLLCLHSLGWHTPSLGLISKTRGGNNCSRYRGVQPVAPWATGGSGWL